MKNNKNSSNNSFTKKWFYISVAFGIVFAIVTTFIAIYKNIANNKPIHYLKEGFIKTDEPKTDIQKDEEDEDVKDKLFKADVDDKKLNKTETKTDDEDDESKDKTEKQVSATVKDAPKKENLNFIKPVSGQILTQYSDNNLVNWEVLNEWKTHDGVDIRAKKNTPVKAALAGVVSNIENEDKTWGVCITITHKNGMKTIYKGLSDQVQVKLDETVKTGDVIGTVGPSILVEKNKGEHLHFEMKKEDEFVNPKDYIDF